MYGLLLLLLLLNSVNLTMQRGNTQFRRPHGAFPGFAPPNIRQTTNQQRPPRNFPSQRESGYFQRPQRPVFQRPQFQSQQQHGTPFQQPRPQVPFFSQQAVRQQTEYHPRRPRPRPENTDYRGREPHSNYGRREKSSAIEVESFDNNILSKQEVQSNFQAYGSIQNITMQKGGMCAIVTYQEPV